MSMTITADRRNKLTQIGCFRGGHNDHILSIGSLSNVGDRLLSTSRDKTLLMWKLKRDANGLSGTPFKRFTGHSHFVTDVTTSSDSRHCITSSWDNTLRLWDLEKGISTRSFIGHTKDVLSVEFSGDNRQIISGGRDKTVKIWNTLARVAYSSDKEEKGQGHSDWVSAVGVCSTQHRNLVPTFVSASWDSSIKIWNLRTFSLERTLNGPTRAPFTSMALCPDSSICAVGTKDGYLSLFNIDDFVHLWAIPIPADISAVIFCPENYRIYVAAGSTIYVYDLTAGQLVDEVTVETPTGNNSPDVTCMKWSSDGTVLFAGYADGCIRAWKNLPMTTITMSKDDYLY